MDVILLDKIGNLGQLGDKVSVKNGFARNYLIPQGKAKPATAENLAEFEKRRAELEQQAAAVLAAAEARKARLVALETIVIPVKASNEGKLFGSIGSADIVAAVTAAGIELTRQEVNLPNGNLRNIGEYEIQLQLHADVTTILPVRITAAE